MTHAFVSPLNLAPIFFNSSLKWKVGPVEIVSAERCCSFVFSIFWLKKGGTSPKNTRKDQWFRYRLTWGATWKTGPFRWELPRGRWKFIGKWEIFHVELPAVKFLVLSVANSDIDFSELTCDVFRFFWVWCFQQNHPRDSMVAYPNCLFNSLDKKKHAACDKSSNFLSNQSEFNKKKKRRHIRRLEHPAWATKLNPSYFPWNTVVS